MALQSQGGAQSSRGPSGLPASLLESMSLESLVESVSEAIKQHISAEAPKADARPIELDARQLARMIDHTVLKPEATRLDIQKACAEAREHGFATICVNSTWVKFVAEQLEGSSTVPIAVVGFPLGACLTSAKVFETREAVRLGAKEIDMVINIGALTAGQYASVLDDIHQVVAAAAPFPVKVILETCLLNQEQKIIACVLCKAAGAAFVKTSTGFGKSGATVDDIVLMRRVVGPDMGVKASGGIRTLEDARKMITAGASRIGASASVAIVEQLQGKSAAKSDTSGY